MRNSLIIFAVILLVGGCSKKVDKTENIAQIQYMDKSPYHLSPFEKLMGGDLIKLEGEFYTLVDAEGYINEGSNVKVVSEGNRVLEVCQILIDELNEFSKCFSVIKV